MIIATAMRRSEVLGLRWSDIDWTARTLSIRQTVIEYGNTWSLRESTKAAASRRTLSLAPETIEALRRQQARVAELRLKIGRYWQDNDLVFPATGGGPRVPRSLTLAFTRATRRAGWPANSSPVHSLRHVAASLALARGVDIATISRRLGHASTAVTAAVYLHPDPDRDRAAAEIMAALPKRTPS